VILIFELILISAVVSVFALLLVAYFNYSVSKKSSGNEKMKEIQHHIRDGAKTFMFEEIRIFAVVLAVIAVILALIFYWEVAAAFIIGAVLSMTAGLIGMHGATLANAKVTNAARKDSKSALDIALSGGAIMGFAVAGLALGGLTLILFIFRAEFDPVTLAIESKELFVLGPAFGLPELNFIKAALIISAYSMGASLVALFDRVGGGIYTKAADMGADIVGKAETHLPEDDPRNPATIADNVGDNVGDVGGLGADLLESFIGAVVSVIIIVLYLFVGKGNESIISLLGQILKTGSTIEGSFWWLILLPLIVISGGIIASFIGVVFVLSKRGNKNLHTTLTRGTWIAAILTIAIAYAVIDMSPFSLNVFFTITVGIASGVVIGMVSEYFTSSEYNPVKKLAASTATGPAIGITQGMSLGMLSTFVPGIVIATAITMSYFYAGLVGIAFGALGMLSFVAMTVTVDTYGPIADNAGGIAEGAKLPAEVRKRTDKLDAIGNTTAAVGKGFAIGSAAFAALALIVAYMWSAIGSAAEVTIPTIEILSANPALGGTMIAAMFIGAMIPYVFSALLIRGVSDTADKMIHEVRRQFKEKPGILKGTVVADYNRCIEITSQSSLKKMVLPALITIIMPLVIGLVLGKIALAGFLIAALLSCMQLAIYCANTGGALDNAKKYIEEGHFGGKGSDAHIAGVIGDTVGDPLKDTVGPSLDILVKLMAIISILFASLFPVYPIIFGAI